MGIKIMADLKLRQRLKEIFSSVGPLNPDTQKNTKFLSEIITNLNKNMLIKAKDTCKAEYDDLSKYAEIKNVIFDVKPNAVSMSYTSLMSLNIPSQSNVDEKKLHKSSEKFQLCVEKKNKKIFGKLKNFEKD